MRATRQARRFRLKSGQRGFAMAFVFVLIALLLLVAILVVTGAFNAVDQAEAVGVKYAVMNSAEAAANIALNRLAAIPTESNGCITGTLNGDTYQSCLGKNNLGSGSSTTATDYANGQPIYVPAHAAYIYGESDNQGSRKVYIEAIAQPAPPLNMPPGALNAAGNVNDTAPEPINQDPLHANDANVHANNNIAVGGYPSLVQGSTYAVGTDALIPPAQNGTANSGASPVYFPTATQVKQASRNARLYALAGTNTSGATISSTGTATYTGNYYVNGDINMSSGVVTFAGGSYVYVNGNVCLSGTAALLNQDQAPGSIMVVSGVVSSSGSGGYTVTMPANTLLMALGADPGAVNPCGSSATDALSLSPVTGVEPVGTVFAPNGSVGIGGTGTVQGSFDGGVNVDVTGSPGSAIQYDANQANTTMTTGTMTYTAYNQD